MDPGWVQIVTPGNARSEIDRIVAPFGARSRELEEFVCEQAAEFPTSYIQYGSREFRRLSLLRPAIVRHFLKETKRLLHIDSDVGWFRNPLDYLERVLEHYPLTCQTEAVAQFPPSFCVGFYAIGSSPEARDLLDRYVTACESSDLDDQQTFNKLMSENPSLRAKVFPLPEALFANGLLYNAFRSRANAAMTVAELKPFIFHANWTIGKENKRRLLIGAGAWLVEDTTVRALWVRCKERIRRTATVGWWRLRRVYGRLSGETQ
jgi:hypothetical protein